ncbi:MAG: prephenate dehydrogenase [Candidatus Scalindua sp. AMX11]|nr:MAG: prephenate dehydrogenase [Candidatus Scalindua sp.]NOG85627.1 prephenate dehydrogenase [Planctomycetota bacterium]RZV82475.1 MAG: prephenate dehydrogenase [Candidatus Scalindua sp. SCAELEC01]TDE65600.1 MAG: prephenate dehydrogenase [Candidatus Scalindua sp. AMX11]GJQ59206.1 MAG: cyclohexadienyl dehydrogenase [Candidatus Scalindua sp.]
MNFGIVTIIGTGLIGGSIGLGLKQRGLATLVIGVGHRKLSLDKALEIQAIDEGTCDIGTAVERADIVILATSVDLIPGLAKKIVPSMKRGAILTDVGSTKGYIVSQLEDVLKENGDTCYFIGAHPLAGSEQRGVEFALPDLFEGSICVLTPANRSPKECTKKITDMWNALGAKVKILNPRAHDEIVAYISHLPHFVASGLTNVINDEYWGYGANGLKDTTRVASGDPELWASICKQNRLALVSALRQFSEEIKSMVKEIEEGNDNKVLERLQRAKSVRDSYLK